MTGKKIYWHGVPYKIFRKDFTLFIFLEYSKICENLMFSYQQDLLNSIRFWKIVQWHSPLLLMFLHPLFANFWYPTLYRWIFWHPILAEICITLHADFWHFPFADFWQFSFADFWYPPLADFGFHIWISFVCVKALRRIWESIRCWTTTSPPLSTRIIWIDRSPDLFQAIQVLCCKFFLQ